MSDYEAEKAAYAKLNALSAEYEAVREEMRKAARFARVSTAPKTVAKWQAAYEAGQARLVAIVDEKREVRCEPLRALEVPELLNRLAGAMNRSYEATMGDYSMGSINAAAADVEAAELVLREKGIEAPKDLVEWETAPTGKFSRGWVVKQEVTA